jgi:hypothetical protein
VSGYSDSQLTHILREEVAPVLWPNLVSVAGEWVGFDLTGLERLILKRGYGYWVMWLLAGLTLKMINSDWTQVLALTAQQRSTVSRTPTEPTHRGPGSDSPSTSSDP